MASNLTVHITKDGRQYIIVPKVRGNGTKKSYGYFGKPNIDFKNYVYEGKIPEDKSLDCLECGNYLSKLCDGSDWQDCTESERI